MGGTSDDLENLAFTRSLEYHKARSDRRAQEKVDILKLSEELVKFIDTDERGDTFADDIIEIYFGRALQELCSDPTGNENLIEAAQDIIHNRMYRVSHPRLRRLLQLSFLDEFFLALGRNAQVERANENEVDAVIAKKTRLHAVVASLRSAFQGKNENSEWMD